ncbi:MAG TPA: phosphotransferase [Candidatus Dormibacteraeota bacterium]|nr:phosphotransferase [Candidatus Dormibacteraeota bacterium]
MRNYAARAAVDRLWPDRPARITDLGGGITGRNYKVELDDGVFVLRTGVSGAVDEAAGRRAFELGVGPEVMAFMPSRGWVVERFIDGRPISPEQMRETGTLRRVVAAVRKFHEAAPIPGRLDPHAVVEDFHARAIERGVAIPHEYKAAHASSERIRQARGEQPLVPCHNNLLNANILDDGEIRLVDWENASMGDRFFDLANFSVNHDLSPDDDRRLLEAYFGEAGDKEFASLRLMRFMADFREAMWGVLQSGISELDFAFGEYAAEHFARLEAAASATEFESYLAAVTR